MCLIGNAAAYGLGTFELSNDCDIDDFNQTAWKQYGKKLMPVLYSGNYYSKHWSRLFGPDLDDNVKERVQALRDYANELEAKLDEALEIRV